MIDEKDRLIDIVNLTPINKKPIIIELVGLPRLGKSEFAKSFLSFTQHAGIKSVAYSSGSDFYPINNKWSVDYSAWVISNLVKRFYDYKNSGQQIIIFDRGFFDSIVWLKLKKEEGICSDKTYNEFVNFITNKLWWNHLALVLIFDASYEISINRAKERRLYKGISIVSNERILPKLHNAYQATKNEIENMSKTKSTIVEFVDANNPSIKTVQFNVLHKILSILESK